MTSTGTNTGAERKIHMNNSQLQTVRECIRLIRVSDDTDVNSGRCAYSPKNRYNVLNDVPYAYVGRDIRYEMPSEIRLVYAHTTDSHDTKDFSESSFRKVLMSKTKLTPRLLKWLSANAGAWHRRGSVTYR